jgi:hypothetical protein
MSQRLARVSVDTSPLFSEFIVVGLAPSGAREVKYHFSTSNTANEALLKTCVNFCFPVAGNEAGRRTVWPARCARAPRDSPPPSRHLSRPRRARGWPRSTQDGAGLSQSAHGRLPAASPPLCLAPARAASRSRTRSRRTTARASLASAAGCCSLDAICLTRSASWRSGSGSRSTPTC